MKSSLRSAATAACAIAILASATLKASAQNPPSQQAFQGAYFGIAPHYAWTKSDATLSRPQFADVSGSRNLNAPAIAAFGGYDWRIGNGAVFGIVGDFGVAKFNGSKLEPIGALRSRIGQTVAADILVYATGGRTLAQQTMTGTLGGTGYVVSKTIGGWTYGGGVEKESTFGGRPLRLGLELLRHDLTKFEFDAGTRHVAIINGVWTVSARVALPLQ
jgi:opacity protein-like surface antigen